MDPGGRLDLRNQAATLTLTGYYRPEDLELDFAAVRDGDVRLCGNNTGNEGDDRYDGETICFADGTIEEAADTAPLSTPGIAFVFAQPVVAS